MIVAETASNILRAYPALSLNDIRLLSLEQFEAFSAAGRIKELEDRRETIYAVNAAMGKGVNSAIRGIDARIKALRKGKELSPQDIIDAQLDAMLAPSVGPMTDRGMEAMGIVKKEEDDA